MNVEEFLSFQPQSTERRRSKGDYKFLSEVLIIWPYKSFLTTALSPALIPSTAHSCAWLDDTYKTI